jgi:hypothetical protein
MIQLDISLPLGKIAKKLARVSDEVVFYGRAAQPLYIVAMDPTRNLLARIDAGISIDSDFEAGIQVRELAETSKGVRYRMDYDNNTWSIIYETNAGLKVRKKIGGLEPSFPVSEALPLADTEVASSADVDYATLTHALDELGDGDVVSLKFIQGKPGRMVASLSDASKKVEVEAPVGEVSKGFEVKANLELVKSAIEILEPIARSFRVGVNSKGILVIEPASARSGTRILIAPVEG